MPWNDDDNIFFNWGYDDDDGFNSLYIAPIAMGAVMLGLSCVYCCWMKRKRATFATNGVGYPNVAAHSTLMANVRLFCNG